ncbi:MAG TPA: L,D-transpeptidase family protein [Candidatus Polarisedimenticolia bacterium]|nr:L,D-transpeptidase family protein [Candidatus Polarisedimenticolia bacterium]
MSSLRTLAGGTLLLAALLSASPACRSGSSITNRLEEILGGISERGGRKEASAGEIREALQHQLRVAPVPAAGSNRPSSPAFPTRQTLVEFYARRSQRLVWTSESGAILPVADTLLEALERAGEHGLDPAEYAVASLERMRKQVGAARGGASAVTRWADFDLLLTTAFFRYASDLSSGRVHPDEIRSEWLTEPPELDLPGALDKALAEGRLERLLEGLPPPHPGYERLREALEDLRKIEAAGGWKSIPSGPALKKGARGQRVALLRERLGVRGGILRPEAKRAGPGAVFDVATQDAVKDFQSRHGIEPDGIVGEGTLAALNVPVARRVRQVELNLERWRWMPRRLGDVHVEVNIPGFELALVRNGKADFRSRIVAGSAFTPTPIFSDRIVAVVANPPWNVPRELAVREYLPELKHDPKLFMRRGIRIYKDTGKKDADEEAEEIDPTSVSWRRVDEDEFDYRLRQDPGPENALGRMKLHLTNDFQIYLHDTPARAAFTEASRDLSHGCIRVEQARALADRLLGDDAPRLEEALESLDEQSLPVRPPVPIQILYLTAWVDEEGTLRFGPDVYEFDAPQQAALDRIARAARRAP